MKPAAFEMARPQSVPEALALLVANPDSRLLAGGQSLVPMMNFRLAQPSLLIDLNSVQGLSGVCLDGDVMHIGAMTRQQYLLESPVVASHAPLLAKALPNIGHVQTRSRGTIGGSLAHADPSAELPLVMVALDATFLLLRRDGQRTVAAREFFTEAMSTVLATDEIVTDIMIPVAPANSRAAFREIARRQGDFAIVAVAAQFASPHVAVAVGGLEAVPRFCRALSEALSREANLVEQLPALIRTELANAEPLSDLQADADYRHHLATVLLEQIIKEVLVP